jgi:hypothetical protein
MHAISLYAFGGKERCDNPDPPNSSEIIEKYVEA